MKIPAHAKYQIIYDTMQKNDNLLNVAAMCEIIYNKLLCDVI